MVGSEHVYANIVNYSINRYPTVSVDNQNIDIHRLENQAKHIIISKVSPEFWLLYYT